MLDDGYSYGMATKSWWLTAQLRWLTPTSHGPCADQASRAERHHTQRKLALPPEPWQHLLRRHPMGLFLFAITKRDVAKLWNWIREVRNPEELEASQHQPPD